MFHLDDGLRFHSSERHVRRSWPNPSTNDDFLNMPRRMPAATAGNGRGYVETAADLWHRICERLGHRRPHGPAVTMLGEHFTPAVRRSGGGADFCRTRLSGMAAHDRRSQAAMSPQSSPLRTDNVA
jgi:hypothetical protein